MNKNENLFKEFRSNTIGYDQPIETVWGIKKLCYCDYTASGRLYRPIEEAIACRFGPYVGNTHSESSLTGTVMTRAYLQAREIIKNHVNASEDDVLINCGFGMTSAVNKLQRLLGLRVPEFFHPHIRGKERPVVFVSHMEHHSNHTTWLETLADVVCVEPGSDGLVSLENLESALKKHKRRKIKIGAFTACSNVTGACTPYHEMAALLHRHGGICFVDFAASAPYKRIDMHPHDPLKKLDGIFFSPHKFLGGPGSSGVLIFDSGLYHNRVPDMPGGGTVDWTNPWGGRKYIDNIELREDGGTPGFLQCIRTALCIDLKNRMDPRRMLEREKEICAQVFRELERIPGLHILASGVRERLAIFSFYAEDMHYNLVVKLLNDRYGIQARGGCSCAGTYGHYLLNIDKNISKSITDQISAGDLSHKPGWVRLSFHPMMTDREVLFVCEAVRDILSNADQWAEGYHYDAHTNQFRHESDSGTGRLDIDALLGL
jgi:selenocysteine lyase/cysteine desulfurase